MFFSHKDSHPKDTVAKTSYTDIKIEGDSDKIKVTDKTPSYPSKMVGFTVTGMDKMDETVTVTYTITNEDSNNGVDLGTPFCSQTNANFFSVGSTLGTKNLTKSDSKTPSTEQTVTVTLFKKPTDGNVSTTVTCRLSATAAK